MASPRRMIVLAAAVTTVTVACAAGAVAAPPQAPRGSVSRLAAATDANLAKSTSGAMLQAQQPRIEDLDKVDRVVLQANETGRIPAIRRANPSIKIFVYLNASAVSLAATDPGYQPNVVSLTQYKANPAWRLRYADGRSYTWPNYTYLQPVDLGSASYQQAAIANSKALLATGLWDGVFLDDVNMNDTGHGHGMGDNPVNLTGGTRLAATTSFVRAYASAIRATGKKVAINLQQQWPYTTPAARTLAPLVDYVHLEHFGIEGDGYKRTADVNADYNMTDGGGWTWKSEEYQVIQQAGAGVWTTWYIDRSDVKAQYYARAMFLMNWDGRSDSTSFSGVPMTDPKASFYTPAATAEIGRPAGPLREIQPGVFARPFTKAGAIVNTTRKPVTVKTGWHGTVTLQPGDVFVD